MIRRTSQYLVPFALGAWTVGVVLLAGCDGEKAPSQEPAVKVDPPSVYMKDPAFRGALKKQDAARAELTGVLDKLLGELEQRVDAMRAKKPGADDAAVKKELEKDPEWVSLVKRIEDANAALEDNRKATTKLVGDRIGPRKATVK